MTIRLDDTVIHLEGTCRVEEAETLLTLLQAAEGRTVDLTACDHLHTALVQVLLAHRVQPSGGCGDPFIREWILPCLLRAAGQAR